MRILLSILLISILTSCSISKKINKNKSSKDSSFVDKSKIKIKETEKVDTTVFTKPDTLKGEFILDDTTTQVIESEGIKIEVKINKNGKKGSVKTISKPKEIHVNVDKTTITEKDNNIKATSQEKVKTKDLDKETKFALTWWIYLIILLIALLIIFYKKIKKYLPILP